MLSPQVAKALAAQERSALRLRTRESVVGPKDDAEYEWEALCADWRGG